MKDIIFDDFQNCVSESLLRHKSILDIITKLQESQARINRAIAKSATNCGCIEIHSKKQETACNDVDTMKSFEEQLNSHLKGSLCENCREVLEKEIGNNLFYLTSLCNELDLNLYDILLKEYNRTSTLGKFSLK